MMVIENKFELKQTVYLVTDEEQSARLVVAIKITPDDTLMYELAKDSQTSVHYDFEISAEKNLTSVT